MKHFFNLTEKFAHNIAENKKQAGFQPAFMSVDASLCFEPSTTFYALHFYALDFAYNYPYNITQIKKEKNHGSDF